MVIFVTAVAVVLSVSFLCSIFESVLLSIRPGQVEALAERHERASRWLAGFKSNIDVPIAAILILNTAAHTVGAAVAGASYAEVFDDQTLWLFTIIFTVCVLLLTEIIPKTLGVTYARALAIPVAHGIRFLTVVLRPLVYVSERFSRALRRDRSPPVTSVEEIRLLAALGRNEGAVGGRTAEMIVGATYLRQLTVADVMVPRQQVVTLSKDMSGEQVFSVLQASGYSRFPLAADNDIDSVTGVVMARDLLFWMCEHPDMPVDWPSLVREPIIVPQMMSSHELLRTFQDHRRHMAIVVDEYGSIEGIATLEDVLEEIVGEITDESDRPIENIWPQKDGSLHVKATVDLRRICSRLNIKWRTENEFTTVGGLVTELLGRLPVAGDVVVWHKCRFEVLVAGERRAELLAVRALRPDEQVRRQSGENEQDPSVPGE